MQEAPPLRVHLRWLLRRDQDAVQRIEVESFKFPWGEKEFLRCLRERHTIGMVAEVGQGILGFMIYELHKTRLHVLNFAVAQEHRRQGIGRALFARLAGKLSLEGRSRILLEIRESNLAAQLFFRACGCHYIDTFRAHYEDTPEDAYVFEYRLGAAQPATQEDSCHGR
jgi:ribosomal-protein-alanine N-acetyltransferase